MRRRAFLIDAAFAGTAVSGASAAGTIDSRSTADPVAEVDFDSQSSITMGPPPEALANSDPPEVEFDAEANVVDVIGVLAVGDTLHEASLNSVRYDEQADAVYVVVTPHEPFVNRVRRAVYTVLLVGIPDIRQHDQYTIQLKLDAVPERIVVTEVDDEGEQRSTTLDP